jgi:hypothetical protein
MVSSTDVYKAADEKGRLVVGPQSGSVGAGGGYAIGGGHSGLGPQYGMAVDSESILVLPNPLLIPLHFRCPSV